MKLDKIVGELPAGRYDAHAHVYPGTPHSEAYWERLRAAGFVGGVVLSENPDPMDNTRPLDPEKAMDNAIAWAGASRTLYPFYWINPVRDDAADLVDMAIDKGMFGFKVLPGTFMPGDPKALPVYEKMAKAGKPVLFHSGILWDGRPSSKFTRPGNFEELIDIPNLRFCLAHVSWPWCDECIAVYGKFLNALTVDTRLRAEMFIDVTPGTPEIYRREVLTKLFTIGYDVADHVQFGTDCRLDDYQVGWATGWQRTDDAIYAALGFDAAAVDSIYRRSFQTFLFGSKGGDRKLPTPDGSDRKDYRGAAD